MWKDRNYVKFLSKKDTKNLVNFLKYYQLKLFKKKRKKIKMVSNNSLKYNNKKIKKKSKHTNITIY